MRPMLASSTINNIVWPTLASPKLDGVRAIIIDGKVMSRSLKPIPNLHVQELFGHNDLNGFDGELIVGEPNLPTTYHDTHSAVMTKSGLPEVTFYVFDNFNIEGNYLLRFDSVEDVDHTHIKVVPQHIINSQKELEEYEQLMLERGYEGVMIRDPNSPYKYGRSTPKEGYLTKLKRFVDSEAIIVGMFRLQENLNEQQVNELGLSKRSSHKVN